MLIPWADSTVTFNNFGATPDVQIGSDVGGSLHTINLTYPGPGDRYESWTIPAAVLQGWIDQPSTNRGLLVFNTTLVFGQDLQFGSGESANEPRLSFMAVPEPTSAALLGLGTLLCASRRARKSSVTSSQSNGGPREQRPIF